MADASRRRVAALCALAACLSAARTPAAAWGAQQKTQLGSSAATSPVPHRTRLFLKDGSYQVVMSYRVVGADVHYVSAERAGAEEVIPLSLIDMEATQKWEQRHAPVDPENPQAGAPALDPELLKEEAERAALTPEVAPDLSLPELDSVLALDTYHGTPELVPLAQTAGELNHNTAHNVVRAVVKPLSAPHAILELKGTRAAVQMHVPDPVFYLRVGDDSGIASGSALTVDTHGASGQAPTASAGGSAKSRYVIVRTDVRTDARVVLSFNLNGDRPAQEDVVESRTELLAGGHWMKLSAREPLLFGEYALVEVLSDREVNLGVWDFGVHPVAPENRDAIKPEAKRRLTLERRRRTE